MHLNDTLLQLTKTIPLSPDTQVFEPIVIKLWLLEVTISKDKIQIPRVILELLGPIKQKSRGKNLAFLLFPRRCIPHNLNYQGHVWELSCVSLNSTRYSYEMVVATECVALCQEAMCVL